MLAGPDSTVPIAPMGVPMVAMPEEAEVISLLRAAPVIERSVASPLGSAVVVAGVLELIGALEVVGADTGSLANAEGAEAPVLDAWGTAADVDAAVGPAAPRPVKVDRPPLDAPVEVGSVVVEGATVELSPAATTGTAAPAGARVDGSVDLETPDVVVAAAGVVSDVLLGDGDLFLLKRPNMEARFDLGCASSAIVGEVVAAPEVVGLVDVSAAAASVTGASLLW